MKKINILLTLLSLNALLVIIERVSFTTGVFLMPYSFLRLHEVVQMLFVIAISIVISFFLLKVVTNNFELMKSTYGTILGVIFILGLYFNATGNGLHEVASHLFNTFCNTKDFIPHSSALSNPAITNPTVCGGLFINDYYFGNIVYFAGLFLGNLSLMLFELKNPVKKYRRLDIIILVANSLVYAFTFFAYATFDPVLVGFWYILLSAIVSLVLLFTSKKKIFSLPFIFYTALGFSLATIATFLVRFLL